MRLKKLDVSIEDKNSQVMVTVCFKKDLINKSFLELLVFVICGFIKNVLPNAYLILQIYHVKSFKMMHVTFMYFDVSLRH